MKVTINKDVIIGPNPNGIDIGPIDKGIGLERLRWTSSGVVDLYHLTEIWVEEINGKFVLHAEVYPGCQLVQMTYSERNLLVNDDGKIRLKNQQELNDESSKKDENRIQASKRTRIRKELGNRFDREMDLNKLIRLLIDYVINNDSDVKKFLEDYLVATPNIVVDFALEKVKLLEKESKKDKIY